MRRFVTARKREATVEASTASGSPVTATTTAPNETIALATLLAALAALGQLAKNIFVPAMPGAAAALAVPPEAIQQTYAVILAAFAMGQLVAGPIADRFGRRRVLQGGLAVFLIGTGISALASDLMYLTAGRAVQGLGAAATMVSSRAITRDLFEGPALARTLALVTIVFALVPGFAPLAGGVITAAAGWQGPLLATAVAALVIWGAARRTFPETLTAPQPVRPHSVVKGYLSLLADPTYLRHVSVLAAAFAAMSVFFAASPQLFMAHLGVGLAEYGLYPPLAVTGFIIGGIVLRRRAGRDAPEHLISVGLGLMLLSATAMTAAMIGGFVHKHVYTIGMMGLVSGLGIVIPTAMARALDGHPDRAGSAAALQGALQLGAGSIAVVFVSSWQTAAPILAMPLTMLSAVALAMALWVIQGGREG